MARERGGLGGDAFHHVTVGYQRVRVVIDDRVARPIEHVREVALRDRHADRVRGALPQRPGGRLDSRRVVPLGVPRRPAAPLAELLELVELEPVAGQVEQRVQERRAMARRQHEAVAIEPLRRARIVLEVVLPQHVRHRRTAER